MASMAYLHSIPLSNIPRHVPCFFNIAHVLLIDTCNASYISNTGDHLFHLVAFYHRSLESGSDNNQIDFGTELLVKHITGNVVASDG